MDIIIPFNIYITHTHKRVYPVESTKLPKISGAVIIIDHQCSLYHLPIYVTRACNGMGTYIIRFTSNKTFKPYCIGYSKYTDIQYDALNMFPVLKTYASRFNKIPQLGVSFVYNLIL